MPKRTKVICTIGPSVDTIEMMLKLIEAGMDVARINFSHGTHEQHEQTILKLKEARSRLKVPMAIMMDTKGPEIRIGKIKDGQMVITPGNRCLLVKEPCEGDRERIQMTPEPVHSDLKPGMRILFDDGYISSYVVATNNDTITIEFENGGILKSGKGVNIPNVKLNLPAVTQTDIKDIRFGCYHDIDIIAASFVRSPEHVLMIRKLIADEKKPSIQIIAKIENAEGVENFDSIVQVADGIMIARGDLGVEVPLSQVPRLQKMMIRKSYFAGKPAVTATQMLESMIYNPRPTRAEASDVANAIYDSSSAVMLSGETAIGKYPIEAVRMMVGIIKEAEEDFNYSAFYDLYKRFLYHDVPSSVTMASVKTAYASNAKAIFAFTSRGATARLISRLRPSMPIIAMTSDEKSYHQLALNWGITPVFSKECKSLGEAFTRLSEFALENSLVEYGDLVVVTAGSPFGISGTTNMMMVESIGDVLVRGENGSGQKVHGNVMLVLSPEITKPYNVRGFLIIIARCNEQYIPLIQEALGVILQNHINDVDSEKHLAQIAKNLDKPFIVRADNASHVLKDGQLVTLDPEKSLVYKGVVL